MLAGRAQRLLTAAEAAHHARRPRCVVAVCHCLLMAQVTGVARTWAGGKGGKRVASGEFRNTAGVRRGSRGHRAETEHVQDEPRHSPGVLLLAPHTVQEAAQPPLLPHVGGCTRPIPTSAPSHPILTHRSRGTAATCRSACSACRCPCQAGGCPQPMCPALCCPQHPCHAWLTQQQQSGPCAHLQTWKEQEQHKTWNVSGTTLNTQHQSVHQGATAAANMTHASK